VLARALRPLTRFLSASTNFGIRLLRINTQAEPAVTEDEIKMMIDEGTALGVFERAEQDMVSSVFRLGDRRMDALMTPRTEIVWVDVEDDRAENMEKLLNSAYSSVPVARGSLDDVIGVLDLKDLLGVDLEADDLDFEDYAKPTLYVPANMPALVALEVLRNSRVHNALVIGEYGGLRGMVTLHDVLEAIVGGLPEDINDTDRMAVRRSDGSWLIDGMIVIDELREILGVSALPGEERAGFRTLGGFIMSRLASIPQESQFFDWGGFRFEVVDMDGKRVDKVLVSGAAEEQSLEQTSEEEELM
jgi:putative hemolysin